MPKTEPYQTLVPQIAENQFPTLDFVQLCNLIDRADQVYFNGGDASAVVPDNIYDGLKQELKKRDPSNARLSRVGAPIPAALDDEKVKHSHPMSSLQNAANLTEFRQWLQGLRSQYMMIRIHTSFKMDGGSSSATYINGQLNRVISRGDGFMGVDITANGARMKDLPMTVTLNGQPFNGYVRGEIMLTYENWKIAEPDGDTNPRNVGNGIALRKSGQQSELLQFFAFRLFDAFGNPIGQTETEMSRTMEAMGFNVAPYYPPNAAMTDDEWVSNFYEFMTKPDEETQDSPRDRLDYEIDGLVLKVDQLGLQASCGETDHHPVAQIALKFPPRGAITTLVSVEIQMGRTGKLVPVAVFEPVKIGGVMVERATLCNFNEIDRLGIAIGDKIRVTRRADVIPKVESKVEDGKERRLIERPKKCPFTGGRVGHIKTAAGKDSVDLYSLDAADSAPAKIARLQKWVSELDIQGLGGVYLEALYEAKFECAELIGVRLVETPADLYKLRARGVTHLKDMTTGRMIIGPSSMTSILAEIDKKREIELSSFLGALGITNLGTSKASKVRRKMPGEFDTLLDWTGGKIVLHAKDAGVPTQAAKYHAEITAALPLIHDIIGAGVKIIENQTPDYTGKLTFVLTGEFPHPKEYYHTIIENHGHLWAPRFSKQTTHVVTMNPVAQTVKAKKAREMKLPLINPEQMMIILTEKRVSEDAPDDGD